MRQPAKALIAVCMVGGRGNVQVAQRESLPGAAADQQMHRCGDLFHARAAHVMLRAAREQCEDTGAFMPDFAPVEGW